MDEHEHHDQLIAKVEEEYKDILENSKQGIYIYLDDNHKICNDKFAAMLGQTKEEWEKPSEFISTNVAEDSAHKLVSAFQDAMENSVASNLRVTWKKTGGQEVKTDVILVPISSHGHTFALHFVSEA